MKKLFVQILPYLVALAAGILIYLIGVNLIENENLSNLVVNVASGLLSIPLVFICYEVVNKITSRKLHNSLFSNVTFEVNGLLVQLIDTIRGMLGKKDALYPESLNKFLDMGIVELTEKIQVDASQVVILEDIKEKLNSIIHKDSTFEILTENQITTLLTVIKNTALLAKGIEYFSKNKKTVHKKNLATSIEHISDAILTWLEDGERDALENHAQFKFAEPLEGQVSDAK